MDYVHEGNFSVRKASGFGLTVLAHALVACGLIYGLNHTFTRPILQEFTYSPPKTPLPKIEPVIDKFKFSHDLTSTFHPVPLPVDLIDKSAVTPPSTVGPTDPGTNSEGPAQANGSEGQSTKLVGKSSAAIANLDGCKPEYPRSSLLGEETGIVRVLFKIGADNRLISATVLKSSGYTALDKAAVNALSQCHFTAALQNGAPVSSSLFTDYVWTMQGE